MHAHTKQQNNLNTMNPPPLLLPLCLLTLAALIGSVQSVDFHVHNNALATPGGLRFHDEVGEAYGQVILELASDFIWKTFKQPPHSRKPVQEVTLTVESMEGVAYTQDNQIHLSSEYIGNFSGDVRLEVIGVIYHEMTHVWQWDGNHHNASQGLIEGVADYVRLKAELEPAHWVKRRSGKRWDEGYAMTAYFLEYCNGLKHRFVADLNCLMKDSYTDEFFVQLLGKTVDELWVDYKTKYGSL